MSLINKDIYNEKQLLCLLKQGDNKAFEKLYQHYSKPLYANILRMVKIPAVAEEILQDVFEKIWEKRANLNEEKLFKAYLFTIAKHLVFDFFHKQVLERNLEGHLIKSASRNYKHVEEDMAYKEVDGIITSAIHQLPPQRKLVYTLCKMEGRSYEDVSQILGISTSTISDHIVKATKYIRAHCVYNNLLFLFLFLQISS